MKLLLLLSIPFAIFCSPSALFINDTTDHYHWGCTGTSLALKEEIQKLGYDLTTSCIHEVAKLKSVPERFDDPNKLRDFIKNNSIFIEKIKAADVIIINGEGSIHLDRPLPRALLYTAYIAKKFFRKHVEILNHSCYPEDSLTVRDSKMISFYKKAYECLDYVSFREPLSLKVLKSIGIDGELSFDSLPLYIKNHYKQNSTKEKTIILAGSISWHPDGIKTIVKELRKWEKKGYLIKVLIGAKKNPSYDDSILVQYLKDELKSTWEVVNAHSMDEWLDTIASADLLISGRFHHSIAAICLKTKFVIFNSNTPKIDGMLTFLPKQKEVLNYLDPFLEEKLSKEIDSSFHMTAEDFPLLEDLCTSSLQKFSSLKAYIKPTLSKAS